jgi:ubiquinone/menaquinone biosynthesis C-methylase UbiE
MLNKTYSDVQEHWNEAAKTENFRDYIAQGYNLEEAFRECGRVCVSKLIELLRNYNIPTKGRCLLEIGCGAGRMTEFLVEHFSFVYAVDIAKEMEVRFRERLPNLKHVKVIGGFEDFNSFASNSIDIVLSDLVFQHNPEYVVEAFLDEGARILNRGGYYVFQIPIREKHEVIRQKTGAIDMVYWTKKEIMELAEKNSYKVIREPQIGSHYIIFQKV